MATRFSKERNKNINRIVFNYNRRLKRLEKAGVKNLPTHQYVKELKNRFQNSSDLNRELRFLERFNRSELQKTKPLNKEADVKKWQVTYLQNNAELAKQYWESQYERIDKRLERFPGQRTYLDNISAKIDILNKDISEMTSSEFRSAVSAVQSFTMSPRQRAAQYRGFLSEVEWIMEITGYTQEERDEFFNKFSKLTPSQFIYAYDNNAIIEKVFSLYHKDYGDEEARITDPKNADTFIELLLSEIDDIIKDAQQNMD